ncbi:hypothetical protein V1512DRAFT_257554 [Lipomyces arxii]|uniref:uncharacterized protein n=1 Tax=Lipomyces arxii TaxID=56418 RepID=UPI0034CEEC1D
MSSKKIVVIGAGVAGLTSALLLARKGYDVTIVAKFAPGDYDIEYTSPWAGANWMSFVKNNQQLAKYDEITYCVFQKLVKEFPEAGLWPRRCITYVREKDLAKQSDLLGGLLDAKPWFADTVENFTELDKSQIPSGYVQGIAYDSFCINVQIYLPWLQSQCFAAGITLKLYTLKHIKEACNLHSSGEPADLIVNCTGLMASKLGGVMDPKVYPGRGQTVLVRNHAPAMYNDSGTDDADDELTYIMSRPGGGSILGGCYQKGNWNPTVDPNMADRIVKRALKLCPGLERDFPLDIVRHNVGLRPGREGGPRVELETISEVGKVVHNYGAGGAGYQSSYGMAEHVVQLVDLAFA